MSEILDTIFQHAAKDVPLHFLPTLRAWDEFFASRPVTHLCCETAAVAASAGGTEQTIAAAYLAPYLHAAGSRHADMKAVKRCFTDGTIALAQSVPHVFGPADPSWKEEPAGSGYAALAQEAQTLMLALAVASVRRMTRAVRQSRTDLRELGIPGCVLDDVPNLWPLFAKAFQEAKDHRLYPVLLEACEDCACAERFSKNEIPVIWKLEYPPKISKQKRLAVAATLRLAALETAEMEDGIVFRGGQGLLLPSHLRLLALSLCHRIPGMKARAWTGESLELVWTPAATPKWGLPAVLQDLLNPAVADPAGREEV